MVQNVFMMKNVIGYIFGRDCVTIYEIAEKAGVSAATVSRVINNKGSVKESTRRQVLQVMDEAHFTVNDLARSLSTRSTMTIAMLAADIREYYYTHIAYSIERSIAKKGYYSFLCNIGYDSERQKDYVHAMVSRRVSAIVLIGTPPRDNHLTTTLLEVSKETPIIITNGNIPSENIFCIQRDDAAGIRMCVDHLLAQGADRLLFVTDYHSPSDWLKQMVFEEYAGHLRGRLVRADTSPCPENPADYTDFAQRVTKGAGYDGIVCSSDDIAAKLVKAMTDRGIPVPQECRITGFDNLATSTLTSPELTTVDTDIEKQGEIAVEMLGALCAGKTRPENMHLVTPSLIVRGSTVAE